MTAEPPVVLPYPLAARAVDVLAALADPDAAGQDLADLRAEAGEVADAIVESDALGREVSRS